nr:MAG TPA: hypothetical protein [Caudoviricetes sp.]
MPGRYNPRRLATILYSHYRTIVSQPHQCLAYALMRQFTALLLEIFYRACIQPHHKLSRLAFCLRHSQMITPITPKNIDTTSPKGYYNPIKTIQRAGGWIAGMQ